MTISMRLMAFAVFAFPVTLWAAGGHSDPIAPVLLGVFGILFFALLGRLVARQFGQPSVLGELLIGITIGNLIYFLGGDFILVLREGTALFDIVNLSLHGEALSVSVHESISDYEDAEKLLAMLQSDYGGALYAVAQTVDTFSRYGVIFLLFLVGLESSVEEMREAGTPSIRVAIVGMVSPFILGLGVTWLLMPEANVGQLLFIGATLGATSVGITARVLKEMGQIRTEEARVILGAAIVDDVLGLISLAIVSGVVVSGSIDPLQILKIIGLSSLFVVAAFYAGPPLIRAVITTSRSMLQLHEAKIYVSLMFVMSLAWFANLVGLATIIGAFAAGLILNDAYFKKGWEEEQECASIKNLMAPIESIMVPIFFVLIGLQVKLESFFDMEVIIFASGLTVAAIIGKVVSGYAASGNLNKLAIGVGMLPRGEVGLIFATIGKGLGVIDDSLFSAVVLMVVITTLLSPPLLKRLMTEA